MSNITYKLKDGITVVPRTTTITGRYRNMGGLMEYAWKEGKEGRELNQRRDEAGVLGSAVHHLIECYITAKEPDRLIVSNLSLEDAELVQSMFVKFKEWWRHQNVRKVLGTEISLVSEMHRFGGTIDLIAETGLTTAIIMDWKTGKDIYPDMVQQMGAYSWLCEECLGTPIQAAHIVRLTKTHKNIKMFPVKKEELELGLKSFLKHRESYDMETSLTKAVERIRNDAIKHNHSS